METMKQCKECHKDKLLFEFSRQVSAPGGYRYKCKDCVAKKDKERYEGMGANEQAKRVAAAKEWSAKNAEAVKEAKKKYYEKSKEK